MSNLNIFHKFPENSVKNQQKQTATQYQKKRTLCEVDSKDPMILRIQHQPKTLSTYFKNREKIEISHLSQINLPPNHFLCIKSMNSVNSKFGKFKI